MQKKQNSKENIKNILLKYFKRNSKQEKDMEFELFDWNTNFMN